MAREENNLNMITPVNYLSINRNNSYNNPLRAVVSNYGESGTAAKLRICFSFTKKSLSVNYFQKQYSTVPASLWFGEKIKKKFEIWVTLAERRVKIMQIRGFSKRSYKTTETCVYLKFTWFFTHLLKLLSTYILSRSMLSFHSFNPWREVNVSYFVDTVNFTVF